MPPANIDMDAIREAIARRQKGGAAPALGQVTSPGGPLPTGGPNTPTVPVAQPPAQVGAPAPAPTPAPKAGMKQVTNFDDETRGLAKTLISKLMNVL